MSTVLCHNCCPSIPKGLVCIISESGLSDNMSDNLIDHHVKYCKGNNEQMHEMPLVQES